MNKDHVQPKHLEFYVHHTYTIAVDESISTVAVWSLNAVVRKQPNVSAARTVSVNANMVLALAKKVFMFTISHLYHLKP